MPTRLTVVGATGTQGAAVIDAALATGTFQIRGITRNTSSSASQALSAKGVEMVKANLLDYESVETAFADSDAIFAMTDFFQPFIALEADAEKSMELEWKHALNIITAAAETKTLKHFVWSTLPHAERISGGSTRFRTLLRRIVRRIISRMCRSCWPRRLFCWLGGMRVIFSIRFLSRRWLRHHPCTSNSPQLLETSPSNRSAILRTLDPSSSRLFSSRRRLSMADTSTPRWSRRV